MSHVLIVECGDDEQYPARAGMPNAPYVAFWLNGLLTCGVLVQDISYSGSRRPGACARPNHNQVVCSEPRESPWSLWRESECPMSERGMGAGMSEKYSSASNHLGTALLEEDDHASASGNRQRALCHLPLYRSRAGFSIRSRASAACRLQASPLSTLAASNSCPSIRESDRLNVRGAPGSSRRSWLGCARQIQRKRRPSEHRSSWM